MIPKTPSDITIRQFLCSHIDPSHVETFVDIGCGSGFDLAQIAQLLPDAARLIGIDKADIINRIADSPIAAEPRLTIIPADISQSVPLPDHTADVVYSNNVIECLIDKEAYVREIHRVLRPDGQLICSHYDWDTQVLDGVDKELIRKIVHAYGDCKQKWMDDCDSWMGRRLWRTFQHSRLFEGEIHAKVLTETEFVPGTYGYEAINSFEMLVRRGLLGQDEFDSLKGEIERLHSVGEYFYSITMYAYVGRAL